VNLQDKTKKKKKEKRRFTTPAKASKHVCAYATCGMEDQLRRLGFFYVPLITYMYCIFSHHTHHHHPRHTLNVVSSSSSPLLVLFTHTSSHSRKHSTSRHFTTSTTTPTPTMPKKKTPPALSRLTIKITCFNGYNEANRRRIKRQEEGRG